MYIFSFSSIRLFCCQLLTRGTRSRPHAQSFIVDEDLMIFDNYIVKSVLSLRNVSLFVCGDRKKNFDSRITLFYR